MNFQFYISPEVSTALISGVVSITVAIISFYANKKKTQTEIEKMKLEFAQQNKVRAEDRQFTRANGFETAYAQMLSDVAQFSASPNGYSHQTALRSIAAIVAISTGPDAELLTCFQAAVEASDPFGGLNGESKTLLDEIRVQFRK